METTCEFCLTKCITKEYYKIHQKVKLCKKYKDVSFTCLKCSFTTVGIRNIESHMSLCKFPRQPGKKQSDNNASLLTIERVKNKIKTLCSFEDILVGSTLRKVKIKSDLLQKHLSTRTIYAFLSRNCYAYFSVLSTSVK